MGNIISSYIQNQGINPPGTIYSDETPASNPILDAVAQNLEKNYGNRETGIGYDLSPLGKLSKYTDLGIQPGVQLLRDKEAGILDEELADAQSNWSKSWHALGQTVVSEIGLGTLRGLSDLTDFVIGGAIRASKGEDNDYTNPVSQKIQEWQDAFKEANPIYTTPGVNIGNGGLLDWGWWMSNLPSVASSLTLLIPSTGFAKGLSYLGKATKFNRSVGNLRRFATGIDKVDKIDDALRTGKSLETFKNSAYLTRNAETGAMELSQLAKDVQSLNSIENVNRFNRFVEFGVNGFTSRVMENYQEANQVYQDELPNITKSINDMSSSEYKSFITRNSDVLDGVDTNNKEEVAKRIAKAGADRTFQMDMINGLFDVIELYGLRNMRKFMNGGASAKIRRMHRNSIKYPGKSEAEIETILKNRPWLEKTGERVGDFFYAGRHTIIPQLSEGVEEAINYIAQEEGIRYGHVLLGQELDNTTFDKRLEDYMLAPQLYDAAFWGVLGGVVFTAGGNFLLKTKRAIETKYNEDKYKVNPLTGEELKKTPWSTAFELPEIEARAGNIAARQTADAQYIQQLTQIENGIDPFAKSNNNTPKTLDTEEEKQIARDIAFNNRTTNLLMDAMFVGNWDITRAYLESDEVKNNLVALHIAALEEKKGSPLSNEERSKVEKQFDDRQLQAKTIADKIETLYDKNIRAISNAMSKKDDSDKLIGVDSSNIPIEYFQIIAAENIRHQLNADQFDRNIKLYEPVADAQYNEIKDHIKELFGPSVDVKDAIRSYILAVQLGQIESELDDAKNRKSSDIDPRTISGQTIIKDLELRKKTLLDMLRNSTTNELFNIPAKTIVLLRAASMIESNTTPDGKKQYVSNRNSKRYRELDEAISKAFYAENDADYTTFSKELVKFSPELSNLPKPKFDEALHMANVFDENMQLVMGEKGIYSTINKYSKTLNNLFATIYYNEIAKNNELARIATDKNDIRLAAHNKHNVMVSSRLFATEAALHSIKQLYKRYYEQFGDITNQLAFGSINDTLRAQLKEILSEQDMKVYDDAMKIMALTKTNTNAVNSLLPELVKNALYETKVDDFVDVDENQSTNTAETSETTSTTEDTKKENQNSTKSQESTEKPKKSKVKDTSPKPKKSSSGAANSEKIEFYHTDNGTQIAIPAASIKLNEDGYPSVLHRFKIGHDDDTDVTLIPIEGVENTYELNFINEIETNAKNITDSIFNNKYLFSIKDPIIDGATIVSNPVVRIDDSGKVIDVTPGIIVNPESAQGQEIIESISSTGEQDSNNNPTRSTTDIDDNNNSEVFDDYTDSTEANTIETLNEEQINQYITNRIIQYYKGLSEGQTIDDEELYASIEDELKDKISDDIDLRLFYNNIKALGKKLVNEGNNSTSEINTLIDFIDASEISDASVGATQGLKARNKLNSIFNEIIKNYAERAIVDTYKGKKVISLENLLRYVNDVAETKAMAAFLYDKFVNILKNTKDANNENVYFLIEGTKLEKGNILYNASLSSDDKFQQSTKVNGRTLDLSRFIANLDSNEKNEIYEIFNNLMPGDELDYEVKTYTTKDTNRTYNVVVVKKNNHVISELLGPCIERADVLYMNNRGWIVDLPRNNDGTQSRLQRLYNKIMVDYEGDSTLEQINKKLQELVYTPTYVYKDGKKTNNFTAEFEKVAEEITTLLKNANIGFNDCIDLSNGKTIDDLALHLKEVYDGVKQASDNYLAKHHVSREEYNNSIKNRRKLSIQRWFDIRKDSFSSILYLAAHPNSKITVDTINEGGVIITDSKNPRPINETKPKPILGSNHKNTVQVAVASFHEPGVIYTTSGEKIYNPSINTFNTFVLIPKKNAINGSNNFYDYGMVHAYPQLVSASHFNKNMKAIQQDVLDEFTRLLTEWGNNIFMSSANIENFVNTLCSFKDGNNALFKGFKVEALTNGYSGINIKYLDVNTKSWHNIRLFDKHPKGNVGSVIRFDKDNGLDLHKEADRKTAITKFKEIVNNYLRYNVEFDYVQGSRDLKGYAKITPKGKFVIQIPNGKKHEFSSYRDFLINNGVIAVTTQSNDGKTNFYKPNETSDQFNRPRITFKISSPVEEAITPVITTPKGKGDEIKELIETKGDDPNIGNEVLDKMLDDTKLNILKNSTLFREISFGNIKFVPTLSTIAMHTPIAGDFNGIKLNAGDIAFGPKLIDMLNNPDIANHEEAFRHFIHESIHRKIDTLTEDDRRNIFDRIRTIFDAFVKANIQDNIPDDSKNVRKFEYRTDKRYYTDGQINDRGLEEFLIESITRPVLIERLNSIVYDDKIGAKRKLAKKSKSLFQSILSAICEMFNLNINKGTLLEQEYKLFKEIAITTTTNNTKIEKPSNDEYIASSDDDEGNSSSDEISNAPSKPKLTEQDMANDLDAMNLGDESAIKDSDVLGENTSPIVSIGQLRDSLEPENRIGLQNLIDKHAIYSICVK